MDTNDWRGGAFKMTDLVSRLHSRPDRDAFTDVTFILPDGSHLKAHKFVLAVASPVFEAQFFGPFADPSNNDPVTVKDVDSTAFRRLIGCIYKSSTDIPEAGIGDQVEEYWLLLQAAHMYLISSVIHDCDRSIVDYLSDNFYSNKEMQMQDKTRQTANVKISELIEILNRASEYSVYDSIADFGSSCVLNHLPEIIEKKLLGSLSVNSIKSIVKVFFEEGLQWDGDFIAALELANDIMKNSYDAPELLKSCLSNAGGMIGGLGSKEELIRAYVICEEDVFKIAQYLDQVKEKGDEEWNDLLHIEYLSNLDNCTIWTGWEQEYNKIDIYSGLLEFAYVNNLEGMVDHCRIRLARKILSWSESNIEDSYSELSGIAEKSTALKDLLSLADQKSQSLQKH